MGKKSEAVAESVLVDSSHVAHYWAASKLIALDHPLEFSESRFSILFKSLLRFFNLTACPSLFLPLPLRLTLSLSYSHSFLNIPLSKEEKQCGTWNWKNSKKRDVGKERRLEEAGTSERKGRGWEVKKGSEIKSIGGSKMKRDLVLGKIWMRWGKKERDCKKPNPFD